MKTIYTTVDDLKLGDDIDVRSYDELSPKFVKWIDETTIKLYNRRTFAERRFSEIMKKQLYKVVEQSFFMIDGKSYFLDFFMPQFNIAWELNGSVHKSKDSEYYDWGRDMAFNNIGITTIRLSNRDVYRANIKDILKEKFSAAISGDYSMFEYYCIPNVNKYYGKLTTNQKGIVLATRKLNRVKNNSSVLIKTNMSYLVCVLNGIDTEYYDNKEYLDDYYNKIKSKNLDVNVVYNDDIKKVWYMLQKKMKEYAERSKDKVFDKTIIINGSDVKGVNGKAK